MIRIFLIVDSIFNSCDKIRLVSLGFLTDLVLSKGCLFGGMMNGE